MRGRSRLQSCKRSREAMSGVGVPIGMHGKPIPGSAALNLRRAGNDEQDQGILGGAPLVFPFRRKGDRG